MMDLICIQMQESGVDHAYQNFITRSILVSYKCAFLCLTYHSNRKKITKHNLYYQRLQYKNLNSVICKEIYISPNRLQNI